LEEEVAVLNWWRGTFSPALQATRMGLRSAATTVTRDREASKRVVGRLKTRDSTVTKLCREPQSNLLKMEDLAGCRVVLDSPEQVYAMVDRLRHAPKLDFDVDRDLDDYVEAPRLSGYRAVHVHGRRDGRQVEIQLRTRIQHQWAVAVETIGRNLGVDAKHGEGPAELHAYFVMVSEVNGYQDRDLDVPGSALAGAQVAFARLMVTLAPMHTGA